MTSTKGLTKYNASKAVATAEARVPEIAAAKKAEAVRDLKKNNLAIARAKKQALAAAAKDKSADKAGASSAIASKKRAKKSAQAAAGGEDGSDADGRRVKHRGGGVAVYDEEDITGMVDVYEPSEGPIDGDTLQLIIDGQRTPQSLWYTKEANDSELAQAPHLLPRPFRLFLPSIERTIAYSFLQSIPSPSWA